MSACYGAKTVAGLFFYQKAYEVEHARFVDPLKHPCSVECDVTQACTLCRPAEAQKKLETPVPGDVVEEENGSICYSSISFQGMSCVGECVSYRSRTLLNSTSRRLTARAARSASKRKA
ncbi:hypothetical protein MRX96_046414 [Rhipicephalus microplus]